MLFERFVNIGFDWETSQFVIGQRGAVTAKQDDVLFAEGDEVAKMAASDGTETCDEEFGGMGHGELGFGLLGIGILGVGILGSRELVRSI